MCSLCFHANDCQRIDGLNQQKDYLQSQEKHKTEEIPIISLPDADANPRAVMIETFDASIAVIAVRGSRRSIHATILTVFNAKAVSLDRNSEHLKLFWVSSLSERRDKGNDRQLLLLKIRKYFRQDARVHFPKHDHRHLHCYIESDADTKQRIK